MSRLGKKPIPVPAGVAVAVAGAALTVKGPKGALMRTVPSVLAVRVEPGRVWVEPRDGAGDVKALQGLTHRLVTNMIEGVAKGYSRDLEIQGVGFKAALQGRTVVVSLGFAAPKSLALPEGVDVKIADGVALTVSGPDKELVGDTAARLRAFYPAEPYKGKGVRYKGEHVRRKAGKTVA